MKNAPTIVPPRSKEQLKDLLIRAAALEHVLLSAYLFTAYSLKQDFSEGGFEHPREVGVAQQWSGLITGVAVQEMLHLALACNMVSAIGHDPEFRREALNFPISPTQMKDTFGYDGTAYLGLWPFSKETIERYAWFEDYDDGDKPFPGQPWGDNVQGNLRKGAPTSYLKGLEDMQISTLVDIYKAIAQGFANLNAEGLFSGDQTKQVTDLEVTGLFNYPPATGKDADDKIPLLTPVTDLRSALIAINIIIVQGEGESPDWKAFMTQLCMQNGINYSKFPEIHSPPHHETFDAILNGGELSGKRIYGINQFPNWQGFVRNVPNNPLDTSPCNDDPVCEQHVHIIQNEFTRNAAALLNNLYGTMLDLLIAGFSLPSDTTPQEPHQSNADYLKVKTYEKTTLLQTSIRSMVYLMSPLANALTQIPASDDHTWTAGPGFVYTPPTEQPTWESLSNNLRVLSQQALILGHTPEAAELEVWVRPSYYDVPTSGHAYPRYSMRKLLIEALAADLMFLGDRLDFVKGNAPPKQSNGLPFPQHVCYGLNACKGQDITGTAPAAGTGKCATADPHVCSGQNHCKGQGGCGFSPTGLQSAYLQNHPGKNTEPGQVKQVNGYWTDNPHSDSACGSPIMPSIRNTYGYNTDFSANRGGNPNIYDKAQGHVWEFARLVFEKDHPYAQSSDFVDRYRASYNVDDAT